MFNKYNEINFKGAKGFDGINKLRTAYPGVSKSGKKCWKKINCRRKCVCIGCLIVKQFASFCSILSGLEEVSL